MYKRYQETHRQMEILIPICVLIWLCVDTLNILVFRLAAAVFLCLLWYSKFNVYFRSIPVSQRRGDILIFSFQALFCSIAGALGAPLWIVGIIACVVAIIILVFGGVLSGDFFPRSPTR